MRSPVSCSLISTGGLLMTFAIALIGGGAFAQQTTSELLIYPDTNLSGMLMARMTIEQESCRNICSQRPGCAGFDYDMSSNQCQLFGTVYAGRSISAWHAETRKLIPDYRAPVNLAPEPEPEPVAKSFQRYPHRDLAGYDIANAPSDSVDQCESYCLETQNCTAYTYNAWNRKCFLKDGSSPLRLEPRAITGILSTVPYPGDRLAPTTMEYYGNYVMSGRELAEFRGVGNRAQCENLCWNDERCIAFSYMRGRALCALFDDPKDRFPQAGIQSGAKVQPRP